MNIIQLNDKNFKIGDFSSPRQIILEYSQLNKSPSSYFYISPVLFSSTSGKYKIEDVRELIKNIDLEELIHIYSNEIKKKWIYISKEESILLWVQSHSIENINLDIIQSFYHQFYKIDVINDSLKLYESQFNKILKEEKDELQSLKLFEKKVKSVKIQLKRSEFITDSVNIDVDLNEHSYTILQLFDYMKTSIYLPFIKCNINNHMITKINSTFPILDEWINIKVPINQIFFVYQESPKFSMTNESHLNKINEFYTKAVFTTPTSFATEISLKHNMTQNDVLQMILTQFDIELSVKSVEQNAVGGHFTINDLLIDRNVFSYLIIDNEIAKNVFFINESRNIVTVKKLFYLIYHVDDKETSNVILIPLEKEGINVRLTKIRNTTEIELFIKKIMTVCQLYVDEFKNIVNAYNKYCVFKTSVKFPLIKQKEKSKRTKKLSRLEKLQDIDPVMFGSSYNRLCQGSSKQPRTISKNEAEQLEEDKVMEFPLNSGIFYTCEPIDVKPNAKPHIYPGLRLNSSSDLEYRKSHPFVPCCYPAPQKDKSSGYMKWYNEQMGKKIVKEVNIKILENILNPQVILDVNRLGKLPWIIEKIFEYSNIKSVDVLRLGVVSSGDSILHCLEYAVNTEEYSELSVDEKIKYISDIRKKLISKPVQLLKQSFYAFSIEDIQEYILNSDFLDPNIMIPLLEYVYQTNIFIITDDDIQIPQNKHGFIVSPKYHNRTIFIQSKTVENKQQCEILVKNKNAFFIKNFSKIERFFLKKLSLYDVSTFKQYIPFTIETDAYIQYIDTSGKARAFIIDNIIIFTPPTYPREFAVVNIDELPSVDLTLSDAVLFITDKKWVIREQYMRNKRTFGVLCTNGVFIPTRASNPLPSIKKTPSSFVSPYELLIKEKSVYVDIKRSKNIADILKNYVLKMYENGMNVEKSIIIDPKHKYPDKLNIFYEDLTNKNEFFNGKNLYVTSKEIKNRLLLFLKTSIIQIIKEGIVPSISPDNFVARKNQLIFLNDDRLKQWRDVISPSRYITVLQNETSIDPTVRKLYYLNIGNEIVGIQNVEGNEYLRALNVAKKWNETKQNLGYFAEPIEDENVTIFSFENGKNGTSPIKIFQYPQYKCNENCFAAILTLQNDYIAKLEILIPTVVCLSGKINDWGPSLERAPSNLVYIGRSWNAGGWKLQQSKWRNPFTIRNHTRDKVLTLYRQYILNQLPLEEFNKIPKTLQKLGSTLLNDLGELRGKVLACWCYPQPCHGNILAELVKEHYKL